MENKLVLITGATAGIGKETALALAKKGAKVIITGRNPAKGAQVLAEIKESTGNEQIELMISDFEDLDSVKKLASEFLSKYDKLDVLINNAGYLALERELTKSGHESMVCINFLAPFLLTNLLLEPLKKAEQGRIVNISSQAMINHIVLDNLNSEKKFSKMGTYGHSKSMLTSFTHELARRLEGSKVTANSLHPGLVYTNMVKNFGGALEFLIKLIGPLFFMNAKQGAQNTLFVASAKELEKTSGKYFIKKKIVAPPPITEDSKIAIQLWNRAAKEVGLD